MTQPRSPEEIIQIPELPPSTETLRQQLHHPDEIDEVTRSLNIPPSLLNFHLATPIDLSSLDLGQAVYIPVQISKRMGGRKSLYFLKAGTEILAGIFVTNQGIALRFIKRITGKSLPAQTGDIYEQRITSREGELVSRSEGKLEVLNHSELTARFLPLQPTESNASQQPDLYIRSHASIGVSLLWSLVNVIPRVDELGL